MVKKLLFLIFLFISFFSANKVFAHASPIDYSPSASLVLSESPKEISIRFSERVEPFASSIIVFSPNGEVLNLPSAKVDSANPRIFKLPFGQKQAGSFTVSWQVVSEDDGHFTKGAFVFSVGETSKNVAQIKSGFQIAHSSNLPEALSIGGEILGGAMLLGLLSCLFWLWPRWKKRFSETEILNIEQVLVRRGKTIVFISGILCLVSASAFFYIKVSDLSKVLQNSSAISAFVQTASAKFTLLRMCFELILCLLVFLDLRKKSLNFSKTKQIIYLAVIFFISLARARISHAAASHFAPGFSILANAVHLMFKDLWVGGLICFLILFSKIEEKIQSKNFAILSLIDFSKFSAVAFAGGGVTGAYIVWLHLKSWNNLLLSDWGVRFLLLSVFAGVFFVFRLFTQCFLQNAILKCKVWAKNFVAILLPLEAMLGAFVLVITGLLIITTPPVGKAEIFSQNQISQNIQINFSQSQIQENSMAILILDQEGKQIELKNLTVILSNVEKGIGSIVAQTIQYSLSGFIFNQNLLKPEGKWIVEIVAQRKNGYDAVANFVVDTEKDLVSKLAEPKRKLDSFAWQFIFSGIFCLIFGFGLFLQAQKQQSLASQTEILNLKFSQTKAWVLAVGLSLFLLQILAGVWGPNVGKILKSNFQILCEKNNDMWHLSVPMREGKALSAQSENGCMVGLGLGASHFVDIEEYKYFTRPVQANAYFEVYPKEPKAGQQTNIKISIKDLDGQPIKDLSLDHDRILHTIIVNEDFSVFRHIHAEDFPELNKNAIESGEFILPFAFPKQGKYLVATDYMVRNKVFSESFYVNVTSVDNSSNTIPNASEESLILKQTDDSIFARQKTFAGLDVALKLSSKEIKAKEKVDLLYTFSQNGKLVKNLESYLSAPMHLAIVREDLLQFQHVHGWLPFSLYEKFIGQTIHAQHLSLPKNFGPQITTEVVFPTAGIYHIFGQIKQNGKVIDTHFALKVK